MVILLGVLGVLALAFAFADIYSENSASVDLLAGILSILGVSIAGVGSSEDAPVINRYRHPFAFWSVFGVEILLGAYLLWFVVAPWFSA